MEKFEEILKRNNLDFIEYEELEDGSYYLIIPYKNVTTMSFISSLVSDLSNNNFRVSTNFNNNTVEIVVVKATEEEIENEYEEELEENLDVETSTAYYMLKRWIDKLNKQLKLERPKIFIEKSTIPDGTYGDYSEIYILNPEKDIDMLGEIAHYFQDKGEEIRPEWFRRSNVFLANTSPWLLEQEGVKPNDTYLSFPIAKNPRVPSKLEQKRKEEGYYSKMGKLKGKKKSA